MIKKNSSSSSSSSPPQSPTQTLQSLESPPKLQLLTDYVHPSEQLSDPKIQSLVREVKTRLDLPLDVPYIPNHGLPITDICILRFLKARDLDIDLSSEMLRTFIEWRNKLGHLEWQEEDVQLLRMGFFHFYGRSKTNSPICIVTPGRYDPKKASLEQIIRINSLVCEDLLRANEAGEAYTVIMDFEGFGLSNISVDQVKPMIDIWNHFYPEVIEVEYFVNTPWILRTLWAMLKPLLPERTVKKILFMGSDSKSVLPKYIECSQLEKRFGGTTEWMHKDWEEATLDDRFYGVIGKAL